MRSAFPFHRLLPATCRTLVHVVSLSTLALGLLSAQTPQTVSQPGALRSDSASPCGSSGQQAQPESKRLFGIIPNYRTSPCLQNYKPLTSREKFKIATQDATDRGTVVLALAFAGESQLNNSNRAFGQGAAGYAQYFGGAYGDLVLGDYMTEAIFPVLLHQDPRYFRHGYGSVTSRLGYAIGQSFWTHNDSGKTGFNYSEILGNSAAVAVSMSYYADERDARDAGLNLASQIGVDTASNILKEFWPDILKKFGHK